MRSLDAQDLGHLGVASDQNFRWDLDSEAFESGPASWSPSVRTEEVRAS